MPQFTLKKVNRELTVDNFNSAVLYRADKYDALIVKLFPKIEEDLLGENMTSYELKEDGVDFVFHVEGRIITFNISLVSDGIAISSDICSNSLGKFELPITVRAVNYKRGKMKLEITSDFEEKTAKEKGGIAFTRYFLRGRYKNLVNIRMK